MESLNKEEDKINNKTSDFLEIVDLEKYANYYPFDDKQKIKNAKKAESSFFSQSSLYSDNLEILSQHYLNTYYILEKLASNENLEQLKAELLERYLFVKNKMYGLDFLFNSDFYLKNMLDSIYPQGSNFSSYFPYATRHNYSISFLNFSPAIWRLDVKPNYNKPDSSAAKDQYKSYQELLKSFPKEKILAWPRISENNLNR